MSSPSTSLVVSRVFLSLTSRCTLQVGCGCVKTVQFCNTNLESAQTAANIILLSTPILKHFVDVEQAKQSPSTQGPHFHLIPGSRMFPICRYTETLLIFSVGYTQLLQNGTHARTRKGYLGLCSALPSHPSFLAQDHARRGRRADLQAREEGPFAIPDRCYVEGCTRNSPSSLRYR